METWVLFTLLAALMQTIRTAGQKKLSNHLSPMTTTLVRYMYGLPFAMLYLLLVIGSHSLADIVSSIYKPSFLLYACAASVAQIAATFWLIKVLQLRSFAIGTVFAKTEAIQAAVLGMVFFNAFLSWLGWVAIIVGAVGIILISIPKRAEDIDPASFKYGILSGVGFAFTALWLRESSLSLEYSFILNAAITLIFTVSLQTMLCLVYVFVTEKDQLFLLKKNTSLALFVGATSACGSIGWYTAMTYQNAALVRSLGQVELIFALIISYFFFNEKISMREAVGMLAILFGILILLLFV
ncbi:MAG: drug/metabolite transporter (DMT)-like permease [Chitinophagales bacterium]|jgi:drug/metabolite transporter (DMT)-like permease